VEVSTDTDEIPLLRAEGAVDSSKAAASLGALPNTLVRRPATECRLCLM